MDADLDPTIESPKISPEDVVESAAQVIDDECQGRLWIKALVPLLQLRSEESDSNDRVQFAFDLMHIAACERIARILHADLRPDRG